MSSKKLNPFKDFQSDQIQRSSRKIFTAHCACRNAALNLTPVTGTTNGFIFQIINSLIESWGVRLTWFDCNGSRTIDTTGLYSLTDFTRPSRPFTRWPDFTTKTRILHSFAFLCKLELLLFKAHWNYQILNLKEKTKRILVVVVKWLHRANAWPIRIRTGSFPWPRFPPVSVESFEWSHHRVSPTDSKVKTSY